MGFLALTVNIDSNLNSKKQIPQTHKRFRRQISEKVVVCEVAKLFWKNNLNYFLHNMVETTLFLKTDAEDKSRTK